MMWLNHVGMPDLHGFVGDFVGEEEEHEDTNAHHTRYNRFALDGPIHQPNRITKGETVR